MAGRVAHGNLLWAAHENPDLPLGDYHHRALPHGCHHLVEGAVFGHELGEGEERGGVPTGLQEDGEGTEGRGRQNRFCNESHGDELGVSKEVARWAELSLCWATPFRWGSASGLQDCLPLGEALIWTRKLWAHATMGRMKRSGAFRKGRSRSLLRVGKRKWYGLVRLGGGPKYRCVGRNPFFG